jgi:hypothetical protein
MEITNALFSDVRGDNPCPPQGGEKRIVFRPMAPASDLPPGKKRMEASGGPFRELDSIGFKATKTQFNDKMRVF